ncbi:MAG: hypothetical protein ACI90V_007757 [Bacillariaceae sp.]|jgi:hypothetical protein
MKIFTQTRMTHTSVQHIGNTMHCTYQRKPLSLPFLCFRFSYFPFLKNQIKETVIIVRRRRKDLSWKL